MAVVLGTRQGMGRAGGMPFGSMEWVVTSAFTNDRTEFWSETTPLRDLRMKAFPWG